MYLNTAPFDKINNKILEEDVYCKERMQRNTYVLRCPKSVQPPAIVVIALTRGGGGPADVMK